MKDISGEIQYRGKIYKLVFNLNVMELMQEEYGSLEAWAEKSDGSLGEPSAKAVKFGFMVMLNEGIDIDNEENGTEEKPLTLKQVGRMITEIGMKQVTSVLNKTVVDSTQSKEKNG